MNAAFNESDWYGQRLMFWFISKGRKTIIKVILFKPTEEDEVYEVVLGDLNSDGSIDLKAISDNGDTDQVMSMVARTLVFFLSDHLEARILIEASSASRARLYQMAIKRELEALSDLLVVYGFDGEKPEVIQWDKKYNKFVVLLKRG